MHPGTLIMEINVVLNNISDNFYFDYEVVKSNLTEQFFLNHTNKLKIFYYHKNNMLRLVDFCGLLICYSMTFNLSIGKNSA